MTLQEFGMTVLLAISIYVSLQWVFQVVVFAAPGFDAASTKEIARSVRIKAVFVSCPVALFALAMGWLS